jgi:DNA-binding PadR family transcriptional regulator
VLLLLAEQPRHGYELMAELTERSDGRWEPSAGAIYPMLRRLAGKGLVGAEMADGRKQFHLTDAGREYVDSHRVEWGEPWAAPEDSGWHRPTRHRGHGERVELRVSGTATLDVPPDFARLHLRASAEDTDQGSAAAAMNAIGAAVRESTADHVLQLSRVHVEQIYERAGDNSPRQTDRWRATLTGHVDVATEHAGAVAARVVSAGAGIDYVGWHLRDDNPAYRQVRTAAVAQAAQAADDFAQAIGRSDAGELRLLADAGLTAGAPPVQGMPMARAMAAPTPPIDLDPAPQHISATVEATYLLS